MKLALHRLKRSSMLVFTGSFPLNAQVTIPLDAFTARTGATAFVPHTEHELRYPGEGDAFFERCERMVEEPGDAMVFSARPGIARCQTTARRFAAGC
jgi:ectoine hydroxylase-related dioxygenase (phytanoyl-CoA dioxygenase family)